MKDGIKEDDDSQSLLESGRINQRKDKGVIGEGAFGHPPPTAFNLAFHQQIPERNAAANHGISTPEKKVFLFTLDIFLFFCLKCMVFFGVAIDLQHFFLSKTIDLH